MKDNQKHIKEMAKDLRDTHIHIYALEETLAEKLISKGWIKPNKNSVMLSKEKYKLLVECSSYEGVMKALKNEYTKGSKETADTILNKVREMLNNCETVCEYNKFLITPKIGYLMKDVDDGLDEIEKQFSVEIKE